MELLEQLNDRGLRVVFGIQCLIAEALDQPMVQNAPNNDCKILATQELLDRISKVARAKRVHLF